MNLGGPDGKFTFFQNSNTMTGLVNFISELRTCRARDLEQKRINKELANIRYKFKDSNLNGYQKKKYVCKLLYMYILGWEVDFGHLEACGLVTSNKYSEKQIGYLAVTLMLNENHELSRLVVNSIRKDLEDINEIFNCLALHAVANICSRDMSEFFVNEILKQFTSTGRTPFVKKKAGLTLLRIYRKFPDLVPVIDWVPSLIPMIDDPNMSVSMSAVSLITALVQQHPDAYSGCVSKIINRLYTIICENSCAPEYFYYKVPCPWYTVKLLRILQYYPTPVSPEVKEKLNKVLNKIINKTEASKNPQQVNAQNAVLFEALNLAIHLDNQEEFMDQSISLMGDFILSKETNIRYLALETMAHMAAVDFSMFGIKALQGVIVDSLKDKDISVRRRALDLLYSICDGQNAAEIVAELLKYLSAADYAIREEMVLKIAILAEKFATEYTWYIDVIMKLITTAGDHVSDAIWHRVVHFTTNNEDLREYATYTALQAIKDPSCNEKVVKLAGYILGEFGHVIVDTPGCSPMEQFIALQSKFGFCTSSTRCLLLSTYLKFVNLFPEIKPHIIALLTSLKDVLDVELQQRACEYLAISLLSTDTILQAVCEEMPPFPDRGSTLVAQLKKKLDDTEDVRTWTIGGKDAQADLHTRRFTTKKEEPRVDKPIPQAIIVDPLDMIAKGNSMSNINGFSDEQISPGGPPTPADQQTIADFFNQLISKPNGVLYEDEILQIGVKTEYSGHLGRIAIFFGNKSTRKAFNNFSSSLESTKQVQCTAVQDVAVVIPEATQLHQLYNVECLTIPSEPVYLIVKFDFDRYPVAHSLKFPIVLSKFITGVQFNSEEFFGKWRQIGGPPREVQSVFSTGNPVDIETPREIIRSLQLTNLEAVDPNPNNSVGSGIFSCSSLGKIGCLLRVEPNVEHQMYRVTVRTTNPACTERINGLVVAALKPSRISIRK